MTQPAMHPAARTFIDRMIAASPPPLHGMSAPDARVAFAERSGRLVAAVDRRCGTENRVIAAGAVDIPVRYYWPPADGPLPVLVYFHGGGWVIGDLEMVDALCHDLCRQSGALVVSVDYRLAPEHPFPAPLEDGLAVLADLRTSAHQLGLQQGSIFVAGDSAGGNIAAVLALIEAQEGRDLAGQVLIYPVTDVSTVHPSMARFATGLNLDRATMDWFTTCYLPDPALRADWRISPLLAPMDTAPAPALVVTAGYDPLHDEGAAYADRLSGAGTHTEYLCFATQIHGFANQTTLSADPFLLRDAIAGFVMRRASQKDSI